jgi:hypothetical protein
VAIGLLGLGGCGGGGSKSSTTTHTSAASAERTRLESHLRSTLESPTSPVAAAPDLDACLVQQAGALPLATLRELATSNADLDPQAQTLLARCMSQGKGVAWFRGVIASSVSGRLAPPIPAAFGKCVLAAVNQLSPRQLATALSRDTAGDNSYARGLGRNLGFGCLQKHSVFVQLRKLWLDGIRKSLQGHNLPAAFTRCALTKAAQIGPNELIKLVQAGSAAETAYGEKLGRACRSAITG